MKTKTGTAKTFQAGQTRRQRWPDKWAGHPLSWTEYYIYKIFQDGPADVWDGPFKTIKEARAVYRERYAASEYFGIVRQRHDAVR